MEARTISTTATATKAVEREEYMSDCVAGKKHYVLFSNMDGEKRRI